jgi:predicted nucleotidyltransferase
MPSPWSDDERWQERLRSDERRLVQLLNANDREVVDGTVEAADGDGGLDFAVVYGSVARGERRDESDLDIYFEAGDIPEPFNRQDPAARWHVFGLPSGALLDNLRRGQRFAFDLIESALIVVDRGPFRELLVAVDAEGLVPLEDD